MTRPTPDRVLRHALVGWGLGHAVLGDRRAAVAGLAMEAALLAAIAVTTLLLADTTWYLLPYLLGVAFLAAWAAQAVHAYHRARRRAPAAPTSEPRSPAATIAWLTLPLLAWGAGFWLIAAGASTPATLVDRFVSRWTEAERSGADPFAPLTPEPALVDAAAAEALGRLRILCVGGTLANDCGLATENLLRDVRVRIVGRSGGRATAYAELVRYERRATRLLGLIDGSELEPVPVERILTLRLEARPAALGAQRWAIVNAEAG